MLLLNLCIWNFGGDSFPFYKGDRWGNMSTLNLFVVSIVLADSIRVLLSEN